jgi:hypothetical protein
MGKHEAVCRHMGKPLGPLKVVLQLCSLRLTCVPA